MTTAQRGDSNIEIFEGSLDLAQKVSRDLGVTGRVVHILVAQQYLDKTDIFVLLQEVSGKGVP